MSNEDQSIEDARAQAVEFLGLARPKRVRVGDEVFEIPNPSLLNRKQKRAHSELQLSLLQLDRWPDLKNEAGEVISEGAPKVPHRKNGVLADDYDEQLTRALLGKEAAERFLAKGGEPSDINLFWAEMNQQIVERAKSDSKSGGSDTPVAAVSDPDSV